MNSIRVVAAETIFLHDITLDKGDVYYLNEKGRFHRKDGPAIEGVAGTLVWYIDGHEHRLDGPAFISRLGYKHWYVHGNCLSFHRVYAPTKWRLLKANIPNNLEFLNEVGMNREMQEYVLEHRPDLASEIDGLLPALKVKYSHEIELGKVDL
jgi:hypothetical protein